MQHEYLVFHVLNLCPPDDIWLRICATSKPTDADYGIPIANKKPIVNLNIAISLLLQLTLLLHLSITSTSSKLFHRIDMKQGESSL